MAAVRVLGHSDVLLDLQTRRDPRGTPPQAPLVVRTRPPASGSRLPDPRIWPPFAAFLADLPRLLSIVGARRLLVRGGAHLAIAFALGAAVPATSTWPVIVEDQTGAIWDQTDRSGEGPPITLDEQSEPGQQHEPAAPVAVYVDLADTQPPGDAFARHLADHGGRYARAIRLRLYRPQPVPARASAKLVADLAQRIRSCAARADTHRVDLFLRVPFPVAVLLGRTLNTLEITLYEWDDAGVMPRDAEMITVAPGRGGGPIKS